VFFCSCLIQLATFSWPLWVFFFFLTILGLEPMAFTLRHSYFCEGFFKIGSHRTICHGWLWTAILLSSCDYSHEPLAPSSLIFLETFSSLFLWHHTTLASLSLHRPPLILLSYSTTLKFAAPQASSWPPSLLSIFSLPRWAQQFVFECLFFLVLLMAS
jgi:hypothetical protein